MIISFKNINFLSQLAVTCFAGFLMTGCAELLPKYSAQVSSPWKNYEEAQTSIAQIVPYKSTTNELKEKGFDPLATPNVQLLNFSDIALRFPLNSNIPIEKIDYGLRLCFEAGNKCRGYSINVKETKQERVGNFWLDSLRFYREINTSGWSFNAIVLMVGDRVRSIPRLGRCSSWVNSINLF